MKKTSPKQCDDGKSPEGSIEEKASASQQESSAMMARVKIPCEVCKGKGTYNSGCSLCGDSTYDHYCNDEDLPCRNCKGDKFTIAVLEALEISFRGTPLLEENQQLKARIAELTTPAPHCQYQTFCTNRPTKGDLCEWHVCTKRGCTKPREKTFHTCEEH